MNESRNERNQRNVTYIEDTSSVKLNVSTSFDTIKIIQHKSTVFEEKYEIERSTQDLTTQYSSF